MKGNVAKSLPAVELPDAEEMPEGWALTTLGEIGKWRTGGTPSRKINSYFNGDIAWVKSGDLKDGIITATDEKITELGLQNCAAKLLPVGTVSVALYGATIGKIGILGIEAATNQACANCIVDPKKILKEFLFYYIFAQRQNLIDAGQGGAQPNLTNQIIHDWPIYLPPFTEQHRIVARVEDLLMHINAARDRLSRVPLIMKKFRQAVLAAACSGRLTEGWREENTDVETADDALLRCIQIATTQKASRKIRRRGTVGMPEIDLPEDLPNTWTIKKIKELVEIGAITDYQDGNHGELYPRTTDFGDNGIKFLTATQVFDNDVRLSETPLLKKEKASQLRIGFAKPRDVLLTHNATVGRVALMPDNCGEIILGTSVTYYRLNSEFIDPKYCCYAMQGQFWQSQLWAIMEQTTRNQVSITKQAEFYFPLPPLAEQHEIVRRVGLLFEHADAFDQEVLAASRRCERLTQAVLGKAFAGKL